MENSQDSVCPRPSFTRVLSHGFKWFSCISRLESSVRVIQGSYTHRLTSIASAYPPLATANGTSTITWLPTHRFLAKLKESRSCNSREVMIMVDVSFQNVAVHMHRPLSRRTCRIQLLWWHFHRLLHWLIILLGWRLIHRVIMQLLGSLSVEPVRKVCLQRYGWEFFAEAAAFRFRPRSMNIAPNNAARPITPKAMPIRIPAFARVHRSLVGEVVDAEVVAEAMLDGDVPALIENSDAVCRRRVDDSGSHCP